MDRDGALTRPDANALVAAPLVVEAQRRLADGDAITAETLLDLHLSRHAEDRLAQLLLADLYGSSDRVQEAHALWQAVLAVDPSDLTALQAYCDSLIAQGQLSEAINALGPAIDAAPSDAGLRAWRGALYRDSGAFAEAESDIRAAIALQPDIGRWHRSLASLLYKQDAFKAAAEAVETAVQLSPSEADSWNLLGVIRTRLGERTAARKAFMRAIACAPDQPQAHSNLGNLWSGAEASRDEKQRAVEQFRKALALDPNSLETHHNLGLLLRDLGQFEDAVTHGAAALALDPDNVAVVNAYANSLRAAGRAAEALPILQDSLDRYPDVADSLSNLALVHVALRDRDAAERAFRDAAVLDADRPELAGNLGSYLVSTQCLDEGERVLKAVLARHPDYLPARINLGNCLYKAQRLEEAEAHYERVLALDPDNSKALTSLAVIRWTDYRMVSAHAMARRALAVNPDGYDELNIWACICVDLGEHEEARAAYRKIMAKGGRALGAAYWSNAIYTLSYGDSASKEELYKAHLSFDTLYGGGNPDNSRPHPHVRDPQRRLRIGYVSPDFRLHSVAYFTAPLVSEHNRDHVEIYCYSNAIKTDQLTDRFKAYADQWRDISGVSDEEAVDLIRDDQVDILVDLAGHTGGNLLQVFARKPAPVQVSYCGYPNTTGLSAMDWRLVDGITDPPGPEGDQLSEQPYRMPNCFLLYRPAEGVVDPAPPPQRDKGHFTFGSFNNIAKVGSQTVRIWGRILEGAPTARLALKGKVLKDPETRSRISDRLAGLGLDMERVDLIAYTTTMREHLRLYGQIDLALDTFPYNGTTTTLEALWMGVPVLALRGDRHAARVSASLLTNAGLGAEFVTDTVDAYVERAIALVSQPERLAELRYGLRDLLTRSVLMDQGRFISDLETAYRQMWQRWCAGPPTYEITPTNGTGDLKLALESAVEPWR